MLKGGGGGREVTKKNDLYETITYDLTKHKCRGLEFPLNLNK